MHRCSSLAITLALALAAAVPAAAAVAPAATLSGSLTLTSDYLFRGISQTDRKPALQAGLEYDWTNGWYLGGWGSNVSWLADGSTPAQPVSNSLELDAYAGHRGSLGGDWSYDAGLYAYAYPGSYPHGYTHPQTLEAYGSLGWKSLKLEYNQSLGNLFGVPDSHGSRYARLSWHQPFATDWQASAHLGHQSVAHHASAGYSDWKLGVDRSINPHATVSLAWYDTDARRAVYSNAEGHYLGRATLLLSLAMTF